ncbi:hypothetical protein LJ737_20990 [Hymenobacter sp. 15J16-1T3B]|uniref:hypothetical protein n=1 Tax=Hymenobacter sp. 15J16-1T3B TaxID=2886941 RepID=UPI001D0FBDF8|nr:hypothetical protein [Hymenobacter sp. 15J16-1T3B]MCC3159731.1 hypothetical protein [Hymenobacter sp. 15J16-1T3B]
MKPLISGTFIALTLSALACQQRHPDHLLEARAVPAAVRQSLTRHFAKASDVIWKKRIINYEAGFWDGGTRTLAWFSPKGVLVKTQWAVVPGALPGPVRHTLATEYHGYRVLDASETKSARTGEVTYRTELERAGKTKTVELEENGSVIRL